MSLISPFPALRPAKGRADDVVAPPYDVLNSTEARERAAGKPHSFLHISKPEIDLPEGIDPYDPAVYAKAAENLKKMVDEFAHTQKKRKPEEKKAKKQMTAAEHRAVIARLRGL